jgi:hypothetical protein
MSHVSSTSRRPSRARRAALVLAAVVALGACSHNRQVPDRYGDTVEGNFVEGCEEALTSRDGAGEALEADEARDVCQCSYDAISDPDGGIPFEDFKELNEELESESAELPADIQALIDGCRPEGLS